MKDNERQRTTATTTVADVGTETKADQKPDAIYTLGITTAANRAISEKWGEQIHPLYYGASCQLAADLMTSGIDLGTAQAAIVATCQKSKMAEPPSSIEYFRRAILDAGKSDEQRRIDRTAPRNATPETRGGSPSPMYAVVNAEERERENAARIAYDAAGALIAGAWISDPENATAYRAIVARANADMAGFLDTKFGKTSLDKAIIVACRTAAGFPTFDEWVKTEPNLTIAAPSTH